MNWLAQAFFILLNKIIRFDRFSVPQRKTEKWFFAMNFISVFKNKLLENIWNFLSQLSAFYLWNRRWWREKWKHWNMYCVKFMENILPFFQCVIAAWDMTLMRFEIYVYNDLSTEEAYSGSLFDLQQHCLLHLIFQSEHFSRREVVWSETKCVSWWITSLCGTKNSNSTHLWNSKFLQMGH